MDFFQITKIVPWKSHFVCIQVSVEFKALHFDFLAAAIGHTVDRYDS